MDTNPKPQKWHNPLKVFGADPWACTLLVPVLLFWVITIVLYVSGDKSISPQPRVGPRNNSEVPNSFFLYFSIAYTCVAGPIGVLRYLRTQAILTRGVPVACKIIHKGRRYKGMIDVTLRYTYDGESYDKRFSADAGWVETSGMLLVDAKHPHRARRMHK